MLGRKELGRLGILAVALVGLAGHAFGGLSEADEKAIAEYPLTMEKVESALKASAALHRLLAKNPTLAREVDASSRGALNEQVRLFESKTQIKDLVRSSTLSVRDFCLTIKAVALAREASEMPPKLSHPGASAEHIQFYREHQEQIDALEEAVRDSYRQRMEQRER
jgi:hypothetical protein